MSVITGTLGRVFRFNPIALREMKARMRGPRAFALITLYLAALAVILYLVYIQSGGGSSYSYGNPNQFSYGPTRSFEIGQNLFLSTFLYLVLIVALLAPALTGGAISREVEARTYELLLMTPIKRRSLVFSKFLSSLLFVLLLVLMSLPVACLVFIFGGVESTDLLAGYAIVVVSATAYCAMGAFYSGLIKQTGAAVLVTYITIVILVMGSQLTSSSIVSSINSDTGRFPPGATRPDPRIDPAFDLPKRLLVFNPLAAVGSVLTPNAPFRAGNTDELQFFPSSNLFRGNPTSYYRQAPGGQNAGINAAARQPVLPNGWALWGGYVLVYSGITLLFLLLSFLSVRQTKTKQQKAKKTQKLKTKGKKAEVTV